MGRRIKDIIGNRYTRLLVLSRVGMSKWGNVIWRCLCDCGNECDVISGDLSSGHTKSCGCYGREQARKRCIEKPKALTHGMRHTPEYRSWAAMKDRCYNKNGSRYQDWGGRGIIICDQWIHSFENFYKDMGPRPKGTSLDRINNDGDYEPKNCRWATPFEQSNNRRHYQTN